MNVKKILLFAVFSVGSVLVGLAIINRLKSRVPVLNTIIG
jgi:hypothetical protein